MSHAGRGAATLEKIAHTFSGIDNLLSYTSMGLYRFDSLCHLMATCVLMLIMPFLLHCLRVFEGETVEGHLDISAGDLVP